MANSDDKQISSSLIKSLDEALMILGDEDVVSSFYRFLEKRGIKKEDIPNNLDTFHLFLLDLFGDGTRVLEKRVAKNLYRHLRIAFEPNETWSLTDYLRHANQCIQSRKNWTRADTRTQTKKTAFSNRVE